MERVKITSDNKNFVSVDKNGAVYYTPISEDGRDYIWTFTVKGKIISEEFGMVLTYNPLNSEQLYGTLRGESGDGYTEWTIDDENRLFVTVDADKNGEQGTKKYVWGIVGEPGALGGLYATADDYLAESWTFISDTGNANGFGKRERYDGQTPYVRVGSIILGICIIIILWLLFR